MAESKKVKDKNANPVGRPKKKVGTETLLDTKRSFKVNNTNIVMDKLGDALILAAIMLIVACIILFITTK